MVKLSDMKVGKKSQGSGLETSKVSSSLITKITGNQATIDMGKMRESTNLFFATPCYGGLLTDQYFLSMFKTQQQLMQQGLSFRVTTLRNESLITRARNILVAMFLESDCTHLMFIDADIEFSPDSILRMLAMDKPIIAGAYPKKTLPVDFAINFKFKDAGRSILNTDNGAIEVLDASTGFFMIKREVIEKMIIAYPELHYKNDSSIDPNFDKYCYALFDTILDKKDNRYLSEDYCFCRRWQDIGGSIWLDPNTKLNHVGSYTFQGDVSTMFNWKQFKLEEENSKE
jgi:hypothetical protein